MVTQKIAGFTPCPHRKPKTNTQHQDHRQQYPRTRILCRQRQFPGTQRSEKTLSRQQGNWMFLPMIPHHKISLASSIQKTFPWLTISTLEKVRLRWPTSFPTILGSLTDLFLPQSTGSTGSTWRENYPWKQPETKELSRTTIPNPGNCSVNQRRHQIRVAIRQHHIVGASLHRFLRHKPQVSLPALPG